MSELDFQSQVERHFSFLVLECGFQRSGQSAGRVRYESSNVYVEVLFDEGRSFELGLLVGRLDSKDPPFAIDEILRLRRNPDADAYGLVQATSADTLATWLARFATALRSFANDFVAGNNGSFAEIAAQRRREVATYTLERDLRAARDDAAIAWHQNDFARYISLLSPFRQHLHRSEIMRLAYAGKHRGAEI